MPIASRRVFAVVLLAAFAGGGAALNARTLALRGIHVYQRTLAPVAARAGARCRFTPSCSRYAEIVIARDGVIVGGWETLRRIARCGPWTKPGTIDLP
jgi:putative membrane protein insertion efficiency factor